jgi:tetraacyldisaccharide 4'-kinase
MNLALFPLFKRIRAKLFLMSEEGRLRKWLFLRPLGWIWRIIAAVRNLLYDRNWLPCHHLPAYVISVGNIVAGGSGKTPLVLLIAQELAHLGPIAILSRGYRAKESHLALGDELTMLSRRLPQVLVYAGKDRVKLGRQAIQAGARVLILDDGMQYRRLYRDLELAIVDSSNPFGFNVFLPCGRLRDSINSLRRADAIFVQGQPPDQLKTRSIVVQLVLKRTMDLQGNERASLKGVKVGVFCAIGQPQRFIQTVRSLGGEIVDEWVLPDHERIDPALLQTFAQRSFQRGATVLICTEKDAVKLSIDLSWPIYYLEMELKIVSHHEEWQNLMKKCK